ncbi:ATP-binding protein [Rhizobium rhizogenes]|uniref:ATP-binding protein n=1 Tax=Rhizobium rhizogenes TaxID=359 RepID=UPI000645A024|nr:YhaN family protein [Rhizobium rhizogenes]NTG06875.1 AAA family ATPase [Rhizobium rhizogenes]NTG85934.1 AAA family ATPase [Rhizobium rhizogenes]NTH11817.1 AAA family ATPase [Rhizobium rhizogenes]NTH45006.1 AAA family ATPase [Rhizobium rhizogenes]NTH57871.1 AAA family ATPase [Rhizobium rhizogenes]
MRFNRLDILRYGALTDRTLDFRTGARLHVIYGPNEAGKSSALSAISDLLFGFPTAAEQSFLHEPTTLRVGASIATRDGATLAFRRRRGRKNTLLAPDDKETPLAEDALAPFLGNLSRDVFERAFGLDSLRLRQGATAMLRSGGEIGSLLFSAASGLTGLSRLRQSLEGEADGIYAQRRSKDRSFYQALDRHDEARKAERDNELKSGDWKKLLAEAAELEAELERLQDQRRQTRQALDRLQTLKTLQPLLAEIDGERAALDDLADLTAIPDSFADRLERGLNDKRTAEEELHRAQQLATRTGEELSMIRIDETVLQLADDITQLFADTGNYRSQRQDLPRVDQELAGYEATLAQLGRRLGFADVSQLEKQQPSDADRVRLSELVEEGRRLLLQAQGNTDQLDSERRQLASLEKDGSAGRLINPRPFSDQLEALGDDLASLARLDGLETQISRIEADLREAAARLRPPVADIDALFATPLPDGAEIAAHRETIDAARAGAREASDKLRGYDEQLAEIEQALADAERTGTIVTREQIAGAREARDAQWQSIRDGLTDAGPAPDGKAIATFATSLAEADRLADAALSDADRVSRHADNRLRQARLLQEREAAAKRLQQREEALAKVLAGFSALFDASGVSALDPAAMLEWRRGVEALFRERRALRDLLDQRNEASLAETRVSPALKDIAEATSYKSGRLPPNAMAEGLRKHLRLLSERWSESRTREGEIGAARDRLTRLGEQQQDIERRQAVWRDAFGKAVLSLGLSADATLEMAAAALKAWTELPDVLAEHDNRQRRVSGMRRDMADFERRLATLAATAGYEVDHLPPDAAAEALHARVSAVRGEQKKHDRLEEERQRAEAQAAHCGEALATVTAALADLTADLPEDTDLPALLSRLRDRARLHARLAESRDRLRQQSEGDGEEVIRAELVGFERVAAGLEIERLSAEDQRQFSANGALAARLAENQRQRSALETGVSAEYAVFEKLSAEQEAKDLARQWVVLKLAAQMLASSMEAYREQQADPVITRAGELFSLLTGHGFTRLVEEHDDADTLQLLAERSGGERVPLAGLSEGTGDQLYLALRLAFLEDYSARNEPAPLIVDDIFQTFDDERASAGLKALAGTAERFQTILFTHEMSVVEIAKREIGGDLDLIRL